MSIIGSIALRMTTDANPFVRGLGVASAALQGFQGGAAASLGSGSGRLAKGLAEIGKGFRDVGVLARDVAQKIGKDVSPATGVVVEWAKYLGGEVADPLRSSFAHAFSAIGSSIGAPLARAGAAVGSRFASAFGPAVAKVGGLFGSIAGKFNLLPFAVAFGQIGKGLLTAAAPAAQFAASMLRVGASIAAAGLSKIPSLLGGVASSFASVGGAALKAAAAAGVVALAIGVKSAAAAAHLDEQVNTNRQVFGEYADSVVANAELMNQAYATNRKEFLMGTAALGGQFQGVGYGAKDAAALSDAFARLAADAAAFRDPAGGFEEALGKIRSGLSGEAEPLKAWGLDLSETAVQLEAVRLGLAKQGQELTNAAKVQARMSLITQGLSKDQGALAREAESPANQIAEFWGRVEQLSETIGSTFAPVLGGALEYINTALVAVGIAWEDGKNFVFDWASGVLEALGISTDATGIFSTAVGWLGSAWDFVKSSALTAFSYIEAGLAKVSGWIAKVFEALSYVGAGDWATGLQGFFEEYAAQADLISKDVGKSLSEAFNPGGAGGLRSPSDYFAEAQARIAGARQAAGALPTAADVLGQVGPAGQAVVEKAKKEKEADPFAAAILRGSKDDVSTVLRSKYGSKSKDSVPENTKRTADATERVAAAVERTNPLLAVGSSGRELLDL
jgi:hypothetical protein